MKKNAFYLILCLFFVSTPLHAASQDILALEQKLLGQINTQRSLEGLPALRPWKALATVAREHSANMARRQVPFGHGGFEDRASYLSRISPLASLGENVAYNYGFKDPLATAVKGWMESPSHRDNILGNFVESGIGIAFSSEGHCYITQLFATRFK